MNNLERDDHLFGHGPKRMLALDGGGVRGILTLSYLRHIEEILRERFDNAHLVLSDYFDLIGGTSTGAIIAAGLAKGYTVEKLQRLYHDLADNIFRRRFWRQGLLFAKFKAKPLRKILDQHFGDMTLGDRRLKTGLMIMAKRWDTGSPWVIHNNPRGKYFDSPGKKERAPNKDYNLAQVVRASTAAPSFFRPEYITIAENVEGAFVDGGVTPHNNPALQMFMLVTLKGFNLQWELGADKLLLVSVGTGSSVTQMNPRSIKGKLAMLNGITSLAGLMDDADALNQMLLQSISNTQTPWKIDSEVGDLLSDLIGGNAMLTYLRYNVLLDPGWLKKELDLDVGEQVARELAKMDKPKNVKPLAEIGDIAAERQIHIGHFPASFAVNVAQSA